MKASFIEAILRAQSERRAISIVTDLRNATHWVIEGEDTSTLSDLPKSIQEQIQSAIASDMTLLVEGDGHRFFVQCFPPKYRLLVIGAVHIAQALVPLAITLDYNVTIVDPRSAFASPERFPNIEILHDWPDEALAKYPPDRHTGLLTLTHDPKLDDPALVAGLRSPCFYIGALGSKKTHAARIERLRHHGFDERDFARIHGPIGIDIGAKSPAEIALSILAEITLQRHGRRRS